MYNDYKYSEDRVPRPLFSFGWEVPVAVAVGIILALIILIYG